MSELSLPNEIVNADRAMELARVWITDNHPTFVLSGNLWENPATWGLLLVDFMKHVASAYSEQGRNKKEVMESMLEAFNIEMKNPTD